MTSKWYCEDHRVKHAAKMRAKYRRKNGIQEDLRVKLSGVHLRKESSERESNPSGPVDGHGV